MNSLHLAASMLMALFALAARTDDPAELTIFAAASLTESFQVLGARFEHAHGQAKVRFNFGGSQQLVQQMVQGAGADIFASANMKQMTLALASGVIDSATIRIFAHNRLVVILPGKNPGEVGGLRDLTKPRLKIVLADSSVPVGQYALRFLDRCSSAGNLGTGFRRDVLANVVSYEENVRAVLSKVRLGECDAGIVYTSDIARDTSRDIRRMDIPDSLNIVAEYTVARTSSSKVPRLAQEFLDYIVAEEGSQVLTEFGLIGVKGAKR